MSETTPTTTERENNRSPKKTGRPTIYSEALIDELCKRLSQSTRPLAAVLRDEDMPSNFTVYQWMRDDPALSSRITRARELGEENLAVEALDIADDTANDYAIDENGRPALNREHVQRSKLRVDTRMRLLEKMNPNRWGSRVNQQITGPNGGPVETKVTLDATQLSDATLQELLRARRAEPDAG